MYRSSCRPRRVCPAGLAAHEGRDRMAILAVDLPDPLLAIGLPEHDLDEAAP